MAKKTAATPPVAKTAPKPKPAPPAPSASAAAKVEKELQAEQQALDAKRGKGAKIRVKATKMGYLDDMRRREGDVFDIYPNQWSEKWMEIVDGETPKKVTSAPAALKAHHDELLKGRLVGKSTGDTDVLG